MGRFQPTVQPSSRQFLDIPLANGHGYFTPTPNTLPLHLYTSREDCTRVQLQKQRLKEQQQQQHTVVVTRKIPGFQTSAAFFASLRTNLRLNASPPPSACSTPPSMRASTGSLPLPSPLSLVMDSAPEQNGSTIPDDPLAGVPELKTYVTESHEDKVDALKLVADSVAQMRQAANSAIIYHPLNLTILVAVVASVARTIFERTNRDVGTAATTCTGLVMILLVFCRYLTAPYIVAAEKINLEWLGTADVIVTKFGDEIIGTVVIEWMAGEPKQKRKKPQRGEIKAWAVRMRYRQKGVGSALLEEAVKESRRKGAETIEFADDHANSTRVLPNFYNGKFKKTEKRARELLQDLLESSPARNKRRRGGST